MLMGSLTVTYSTDSYAVRGERVERSTELVAGRERRLAPEDPPFDEPVLSSVEGLGANEGTYVTVITPRST